jgi:hypothetical protein
LLESASEGDSKNNEVTELDKATFQIAKEYAETGLPDDSEKKGLDSLSM